MRNNSSKISPSHNGKDFRTLTTNKVVVVRKMYFSILNIQDRSLKVYSIIVIIVVCIAHLILSEDYN